MGRIAEFKGVASTMARSEGEITLPDQDREPHD